MKKFRIIEEIEEGVCGNTKYYVQARDRILFIPYWRCARNMFGEPLFFWNIENAKDYITGALRAGLDLGHGSGPLNHCWRL